MVRIIFEKLTRNEKKVIELLLPTSFCSTWKSGSKEGHFDPNGRLDHFGPFGPAHLPALRQAFRKS